MLVVKMYLDKTPTKQKSGKTSRRILLRESYRENGKVNKRTIANLSQAPDVIIDAIGMALKNGIRLEANADNKSIFDLLESEQGLTVGAVYTLNKISKILGIEQSLGTSREAKLSLWMVLARLISPGSKLATVRLAKTHAACDVLGLDSFNEDDLYKALDWLGEKQPKIEKKLFKRRYKNRTPTLYLYDVTSSYLEGKKNDFAAYGYNRDKKKGKMQIVIGLLTDDDGWPVSVTVYEGNTRDPNTFHDQIIKLSEDFGVKRVVMVGDRGMIKTAQIEQIMDAEYNYITAITKPQIKTLLNTGAIQMELFTEELFEVIYDSVRYIMKKNPVRAKEIRSTRESKLSRIREKIDEKNIYLEEHPGAVVEVAMRDVSTQISKLKVKNFAFVEAKDRTLSLQIDYLALEEVSTLDGCYVIKTDVPAKLADTETIHARYKDLAKVETAFRMMKTVELEIRPLHLRNALRTRAHAFIVMLAYMISKYLNIKWKDVDATVEEGVKELSSIQIMKVKIKNESATVIPEPRPFGKMLLKRLSVRLPKTIRSRGVAVDTRKKISKE